MPNFSVLLNDFDKNFCTYIRQITNRKIAADILMLQDAVQRYKTAMIVVFADGVSGSD